MPTSLDQRLATRYGSFPPQTDPETIVPETLDTLLAHRSVRHFREEPLPEGTLALLIAAAQSAATSSNLQAWSVVALQEPAHKSAAATLCGNQAFIREAPLFLVFCADLARLTDVSDGAGLPGEGLDYFEMFLVAAIDTALAAQNAAVAAEALGLGYCYVGAARNEPRALAELLALPPRAVALFGMAVGTPADDRAAVKPRLPLAEVLHHERYDAGARESHVAAYDATMAAFYDAQQMNVTGTWSHHSARRVANTGALSGREILRQILEERGFGLR
jgi:nitroreductase